MIPVCFREGAIDRNRFAAFFYRRFPFLHLDRYVAIYDQPLFSRYAELRKNFVTKPHLMDQSEIGVLGFDMCFRILDKVSFERRDSVLAKQGGFRAAP